METASIHLGYGPAVDPFDPQASTATVDVIGNGSSLSVGNRILVGPKSTVRVQNGGTASVGYVDPLRFQDGTSRLVVGNGANVELMLGAAIVVGDAVEQRNALVIGETGELSGNGEVIGNIFNFGDVRPGNSPGTLTVFGDFAQLDSGNLHIEIDGSSFGEYDLLDIGGNAEIDGLVSFYFSNEFVPSIGDEIAFLVAAGEIDFSEAQFETFGLSENLNVEVFSDAGQLSLSIVAAVPEPSSFAIVFAGLLCFWSSRRRAT